MAKRRGFRKARTQTRYVKAKRRGGRRSGSSGIKGIMNRLPVIPFAYGLFRTPIANAIKPVSDKLPLGEYNDEAVLAVVAYLGATMGSGMVAKVSEKVLDIEGYRAGELTSSKVITGNSGVSGTRDYVYGA